MFQSKLNSLMITALLLSCFVTAQTTGKQEYANLRGTVMDSQNFAMPGASIYIKIGEKTYGTTTDFDGKFLVKRIPSGTHTLEVAFIGYKTHTQEVELVAGETKSLPIIELSETIENLESVTVTGQSMGRLKALNVEHNADNILNVISLEQAEKIPDDNVGDVLKRVAGINVEMDQGEARAISVRGLGPESTNMLIDGERMSSTAYGGSKTVELDLIPANVIQNIEVSKSVSADMDGESNGATVNLVTRSALSHKLQLTGSAYTSFVTTDDAPGLTADINVARRFYDNKLGLSLNASTSKRNYKSDNIEANWEFLPAGDPTTALDDSRYLREFEIRQYWLTRVRHSINISADYEFNDHHEVGFKLSSSFRDDFENRYRTRLASLEFPFSFDSDGIYATEGDLRMETTGGVNSGKPNSYRLDQKKTLYGKFYGDHLIGHTEIDWSASFSNSLKERDTRVIEYEATEGDFEVKIDIRDPAKPRFEIPNLANLYNASLYELASYKQFIDGRRTSIGLDVEHPMNFGYIKAGGRYRAKKRFEENDIFDYVPTTAFISHFGKVPSIRYTRPKFYPGEYQLFPAVSRSFLGGLDLQGSGFVKVENTNRRYDTSYDADERVLAGYLMTKIEFTNEFYIRAGVRVEQTSSDYESIAANQSTDKEKVNTNRERYLNSLPSASLKYEINDKLVLRAGFSRTIKRPSHDQIAPRYRYAGFDPQGANLVYRGNPELRPSHSYNYDLSFKYELGQASSISVDGFAKRINSFFANTDVTEDIGNGQQLTVRSPINIGNGSVNGVEFTFNLKMVDVWHSLRNFSVYTNLTLNNAYLDGYPSTNPRFRSGGRRKLSNTSERSFNFAVTYSSDILEATAAYNTTSPYLRTYRHIPQHDRYYDEQQFLDINVSCKIKAGLYLFAQGKNLTNQPLRYYTGSKEYLEQEEFYGPNFAVGLRYKL